MKERKCEVIRRELEDLMLGDECSVDATQHLRECGECREFHEKQTRLRQIVGSLGTVEAPPDFDFRLRARLANESNAAAFHLRAFQWPFATRGLAVAAMLLLLVGGVVIVRNMIDRPDATEVAVRDDKPVRNDERPVRNDESGQQSPKPGDDKVVVPDRSPIVASGNGPRRVKGERPLRPKRQLVAIDSASEGAQVISNSPRQSAIFPIDASFQSLRVSFDDGRGNARTISVPTISFGSQRVLPNANQFAQKGVW